MSKTIKNYLQDSLEKEIPSAEVDLWPAVKQTLVVKNHHLIKQGEIMKNTKQHHIKGYAIALLTIVALAVIILATPQGRALAQSVFQFFAQANTDSLPAETALPLVTEAPRDLDVAEAEELAGFDVLVPANLQEGLTFVGASYTPGNQTVIQQYNFPMGTGFSLSQQHFVRVEQCNLCGLVGPSASVETVNIGTVTGEYVEGVWNLTDQGAVWVNDPYAKTLRWQKDEMAFEIIFTGMDLEKNDLIAIAENLQ